MKKYVEIITMHKAEVDSFPFGFAFNQAQFEEMMRNWGFNSNDTNKIYSIGGGGYVRKSDVCAMQQMFSRHKNTLRELMQDYDFAVDAFVYELTQNEYCITEDVNDTLNSLGIESEELKLFPKIQSALDTAIKIVVDINNRGLIQKALVNNYINKNGLISEDQLGKHLFAKWIQEIDKLYAQANELYRMDWKSTTELKKHSTKNDIWNTIKYIFDELIGSINDFPLSRNADLVCLIIAYITTSHESLDFSKMQKRDRFALKFERYLARKIINQQRKSHEELEDDLTDKKIVRNLQTMKKRRSKEQDNQITAFDWSDEENNEIDEEVITPEKAPEFTNGEILYIYKGNISCHRFEHQIIQATAVLHSKTDNEIELNVEYCTECNKFILEYTLFEQYRNRYGVLVGNFRMVVNGEFDGEYDLAEESPLMLSGYNVSQRDGYTSQERHYILARIIHDGIMDKGDVIRYLSYFIRKNGAKRGNELALSKWEEDLAFVQGYNKNIQPRAIITDIKKY